mmetsp:Transcript_24515/g.49136  ORF Transcript_24515/g.49136 Transcript_24515/m.49136 type:complete len:150 (-) Transcript_24515:27-476(-)
MDVVKGAGASRWHASFTSVVISDIQQMNTARSKAHGDIVQRGFYMDSINALLAFYPRKNVMVAISERCSANGLTEYNQMFQFLGVTALSHVHHQTATESHAFRPISEQISNSTKCLLYGIYWRSTSQLYSYLGEPVVEWEEYYKRQIKC